MNPTRVLRQAVEQRTPLIKFLGKRGSPKPADATPTVHPASQSSSLPDSFVQYRSKAQQHGPLGHRASQSQSTPHPSQPTPLKALGAIGGHSGRSLGSVEAPPGYYFDRSELPARFGRAKWSVAEIEAVESGGASVVL